MILRIDYLTDSTILLNASGLDSARVDRVLRSRMMFFFFRASINLEYDSPNGRTAALMRTFQRRRKSPFLSRRCAKAYAPECMRASFAARSVFDRRKRKPFAAFNIDRRFLSAFTPFFTLVMIVDYGY